MTDPARAQIHLCHYFFADLSNVRPQRPKLYHKRSPVERHCGLRMQAVKDVKTRSSTPAAAFGVLHWQTLTLRGVLAVGVTPTMT